MDLPTFEDLSDEQEAVYRLPLDQSSLVTGPPGSGKTVLALYRAQRLMATDEGFRVITFSKTLRGYIDVAARGLKVLGQVGTFHSFMYGWWKARQGGNIPKTGPYDFDWPAILGTLRALPEDATFEHVIVDEGQDLHPMFWYLRPWMASSMTIFADQNQAINEDNSKISEIISNADVGDQNHHRLTANYRNTRQIHDVGAAICPEPDGSAPPKREGEAPEFVRFDTDKHDVDYIATMARNHPDWHIGVLCPSDRVRKRMVNQLATRLRAAGDPEVQTYNYQLGQLGQEIDWGTKGPIVLNYQSAKGLQFDHVVLPRLEMSRADPTDELFRMLMYVMVTRARQQLTVAWVGPAGSDRPRIAQLFPLELMEVDE